MLLGGTHLKFKSRVRSFTLPPTNSFSQHIFFCDERGNPSPFSACMPNLTSINSSSLFSTCLSFGCEGLQLVLYCLTQNTRDIPRNNGIHLRSTPNFLEAFFIIFASFVRDERFPLKPCKCVLVSRISRDTTLVLLSPQTSILLRW